MVHKNNGNMATRTEKIKGASLMVTACAVFCVMACLVKILSHVSPFKTSLYRFVVGLGLLGAAAMLGRIRLEFNNVRLLFTRGLLGGIGIVVMYFAIVKLGVGKGMVLASTYPIFAYIFSIVLLKERPSVVSALAIAAAFIGIYFVAECRNDGAGIFEGFGLYEMLAVSVGMLGGLVIVTIRKLHETDSSYAIYFSQCAAGFWIAVVPASVGSSRVDLADALILVLIGATAAIGQLMMTQSYKHLPVRMGATLGMLEPAFCYLAGVILFSEPLSARSVIGTVLIIGSCVAALLRDRQPANRVARKVTAMGPI